MPDYATETNIGAFSIDKEVRETEYECPTKGATETMVVFPLDDGQHKDVRLIKIDVEGHELEVIKGAYKTLKERLRQDRHYLSTELRSNTDIMNSMRAITTIFDDLSFLRGS